MKFDARKHNIYTVPPVNPGEPQGLGILDKEGYLIAYKRVNDNNLRDWDFVRADYLR